MAGFLLLILASAGIVWSWSPQMFDRLVGQNQTGQSAVIIHSTTPVSDSTSERSEYQWSQVTIRFTLEGAAPGGILVLSNDFNAAVDAVTFTGPLASAISDCRAVRGNSNEAITIAQASIPEYLDVPKQFSAQIFSGALQRALAQGAPAARVAIPAGRPGIYCDFDAQAVRWTVEGGVQVTSPSIILDYPIGGAQACAQPSSVAQAVILVEHDADAIVASGSLGRSDPSILYGPFTDEYNIQAPFVYRSPDNSRCLRTTLTSAAIYSTAATSTATQMRYVIAGFLLAATMSLLNFIWRSLTPVIHRRRA